MEREDRIEAAELKDEQLDEASGGFGGGYFGGGFGGYGGFGSPPVVVTSSGGTLSGRGSSGSW